MEKLNQELQKNLSDSNKANLSIKAAHEIEIQDYKNAMANLELKYTNLAQNSNFKVIIEIFMLKIEKNKGNYPFL